MLADRVHTIGLTRDGHTSTSHKTVQADLLDAEAMREVVLEFRPSVILHAAALASHEACEASPEMAMRVNATAPGVLAKIAAEHGATFIHISTDAVFDGAQGNYSELDEVNPFSVYGTTKREGELQVENAGGVSIIARTNFFGWSPSGTRSILEFFVEGLRAGRTLPGYTDFRVSSLYARELIEALWSITRVNASGTFHISSHDALSKFEFGQAVASALNVGIENVMATACFETGDELRSGRDISLNVSKVEALLGRSMQSQVAGIEAALADERVARDLL